MIAKTLPPRSQSVAAPAAPQRDTGRLLVVAAAFVAATIAAGALLIPALAALLGWTLSFTQGALIAALAWVPSALFLAGRSLAVRRNERAHVTDGR